MQLNPAQQLLAVLLGIDPDFWDVADKRLAAEQTRVMATRYLAPHAPRGTPARLHKTRLASQRRLFKGHRA